jgi:hypothetical protein
MRSLLAAILLLAAARAGAATLVVDLFDSSDEAAAPFKTLRCDGPTCSEEGLMPVDRVQTPVIFAVWADPNGRLSVQMARGTLLRYELRPVKGEGFTLGDARQLAQLVRLHGKETRDGLLDDDLVARQDPVQPPFWLKARIER